MMDQKIIDIKRAVGNKKGSGTILISALLLLAIFAVAANNLAVKDVSAATSPSLGGATSFAVLGATEVTNTGIGTHVIGDVGLSPHAGSNYAGLTAVQVTGKIYAVDATGPAGSVSNPVFLTQAKLDLSNAYDALGNQGCSITYPVASQELGGLTLVPGVYCATAFTLSGTLTLTGSGVWIFWSTTSLTTTTPAKVVGGDPSNVWWRVDSSAALGTYTELTGNILALTSITMATGATLNGRALAENAAVTLDSNQVNSASVTTLTTTVNGAPTTIAVTGIVSVISGTSVVAIVTLINGTTALVPFVIPEYPWGVLLLLILMLPAYMLLKRRTRSH
jgi:hypothetical protein